MTGRLRYVIIAITTCLAAASVSCAAEGLAAASAPAARDAAGLYDVRRFGAAGNGAATDTLAIQHAIDAAAADGGGVVALRSGTYRSGTLRLKSHVTLRLDAGATLLGSDNRDDYPPMTPQVEPNWECQPRMALLYAERAEHIAITGSGTIDGQGDAKAFEITPPHWGDPPRPDMIVMLQCRKVRVEGVTLRDSAAWVQHYLGCEDVTLRGLTVHSHANYNNDMIDIDGCRNVRISNCTGNTGDDGVTLKSTTGRVCENITVTNCVLSSHANAIKLGTESTGGFRNITISNCAIRPARVGPFHLGERRGFAGVTLEMVDGGILEQVTVSNLVIEGTTAPLFMRLGHCGRTYRPDMAKPGVGTFLNVVVSNVVARGASGMGCAIAGLPDHPVENVTLRNIRITFDGGGKREDVSRAIPERPDCYPECTMFGQLPAYGIYARHVRGLTLENVELKSERPDMRPALMCEDVQNVSVSGLGASARGDEAEPLLILKATDTGMIRDGFVPQGTNVFLRMEAGTEKITVTGYDLAGSERPFEFGEEVSSDVLQESANRLGH